MSRRPRVRTSILGLAVATLAFAFAFAGPVAAGDPCYHDYTIPPASSAATNTVNLEPCAFTPTLTRVAPGTTVTFANTSEFTHLVTGVGAAWGDRDRELTPGAAVKVTFDRAGIYPYSCALHRGMSGAIIVGATADAAAGGTTSDGQPSADTKAAGSSGPGTATIALAGVGIGGLVVGLALATLLRRRGEMLAS